MFLRPVTHNDAQLLFSWRLDEETKRSSLSTSSFSWQDHLDWLQKSIGSNTRILFIGEDPLGQPVGTCRADLLEENLESPIYLLSWTVAPNMRNKGYGKQMILRLLEQQKLQGTVLRVCIKKENTASLKIALTCGFLPIKKEGDLVYLEVSNETR